MGIFKKRLSDIAILVCLTFITAISLTPTLTSCGGSSGGVSNDDDDDDTTNTFETFQKATSDSNGQVTFTTSKLTNATSTQLTLTLPNGQVGSGLTVDFSESDDQHVMFIIYDPNGNYQTTFVTADASTLSASASAMDSNLRITEVPASATIDNKDIGISALILIAGALLLATTTGISLADKINKVSGTIDPVRLAKGEPECFSVDNLFEYYSVATDSIGLVFWTATTLSTAGATLTTDALYEILLANITDSIKDNVKNLFWEEVVSIAFAGLNVSRDTKMCWQLYNSFTDSSGNVRYNKIFEVRPDKTCSTSADCASVTAVTQNLNAIDNDGDGYTPNQSDCDDYDAMTYPGAFEICDSGIDYNCDGATTTCNVTTNLFMDCWPICGLLSDGGSGDVSLILLQGSFVGAGSDTILEARIVLNDNAAQVLETNTGEGYAQGDSGFLTYVGLKQGLNRITVAGQQGTHYGSKTYYYNNTTATPTLDIMLNWDECPNLDLYIVEPDTGVIYSGNTTGNYGSMTYTTAGGWGLEIYKVLNPAANQTYYYYVKHAGNGSCGASGHSANYTIRVFTPYGDTIKTGSISEGGTSSIYEVSF